MKKFILLFLAAAVAFSAAGCAKKADKVLAKVNNTVITLGEFEGKIEKLPKHYQDIINAQKEKYLDEIIREELLYQEGLRLGIDRDPETEEMVAEARKKIIVSKLINDKVNSTVTITDDELKKYYDEHSEEFMLPERWRASHILLSTREEAQEVLDKLRAGEDFEQLARERSKDATSKQGGDVGYFSKGQLIPEFEEACFALEVGAISDILETQFGYHIVKLTDKKSPEVQSFDDVKEVIRKELDRERKRELFESMMSGLKEKASIAIEEGLIKAQGENKEAGPQAE